MGIAEAFFRWIAAPKARRALPQTQGEVRIQGPAAPVRVYRDGNYIPHILAQSAEDALFALGYVHSQDRLWQMEFTRRFGEGTLAEIFGAEPVAWEVLSARFRGRTLVDLDRFIRTVGLRRAADASLHGCGPEERRDLESYAKGINAWLEGARKRLPLEIQLLRYRPRPWEPADTLVLAKTLAFQLTTSIRTHLLFHELRERMAGEEAALDPLRPQFPASGLSVSRWAGAAASGVEGEGAPLASMEEACRRFTGMGGEGQGSNNWVVSGSRTASGKPILCNDPHLTLTAPAVWYLVHLRCPEFEVVGASHPGMPGVILGRNRSIAWGFTNVMADDADLYLEEVHPENPDLYRVGHDWQRMEVVEETIAVRGGRPVPHRVRLTRHGPVLSDLTSPLAPGRPVVALRWTALEATGEIASLSGLGRARNWTEFLRACSHYTAPAQNVVYADVEGNIGYCAMGAFPRRAVKPAERIFGSLPGAGEQHEWCGMVPFEENPKLFNPAEGYIVTANNRIVEGDYPHYISHLWEPPYRAERIRESLSERAGVGMDDMKTLQMDVRSLHAARFVAKHLHPLIRKAVGRGEEWEWALAELADWDGDCAAHSRPALLFHVFYVHLLERIFKEGLGEQSYLLYVELFNQAVEPLESILSAASVGADPSASLRAGLHVPPAGAPTGGLIPLEGLGRGGPMRPPVSSTAWLRPEEKDQLLAETLRQAVGWLEQRVGRNRDRWTWGELHRLTIGHPFGVKKMAAKFFNLGPYPQGGDNFTVNNGFFYFSTPYSQVVGSSYRQIIDFSDLDNSLFVTYTGQSGNPLSPHYRDMVEKWRKGEYVTIPTDETKFADAELLVLCPES